MVKRIRRHEAVNKMADYSASNAAAKKKSTTLQDEGELHRPQEVYVSDIGARRLQVYILRSDGDWNMYFCPRLNPAGKGIDASLVSKWV